MMAYKLVAMDLDGTLTQHKSKLEAKNKELLNKLSQKYKTIIVGAGSCERIYNQLDQYPIDIIGNYGMQESNIINNKFYLVKNYSYTIDKDFFIKTIAKLRKITGYTSYIGDSIEFHKSGAVTFPLIGTKAALKDKLIFDPNGAKRTAIYEIVTDAFKDFNCFIGGTSSFDIIKKDYDKYLAIMRYAKEHNIKKHEILYVGDDFKKGGNDEQVLINNIDCIKVDDYSTISILLEERGII
jgi:HAD superfamily hydrolase (TIGR01484 family)